MKGAVVGMLFAAAYLFFPRGKSIIRKSLEDEYDYVIVGSGSAGAILAARLSEDENVTVALLEGGPDIEDHPYTYLPSLMLPNALTKLNWRYPFTQVLDSSDGSVDKRKGFYNAGKVLGGSSTINFLLAVRGSRHDYDYWESLGNKGWSYEDVLPYFKKLERVMKPEWIQSGYRGANGLIDVKQVDSHPLFIDSFLKGAESVGYDINPDYNGETIFGATKAQFNIKGVRVSTAGAYLQPAMARSNLHVLTEAFATKVSFEGKKAVGIEYLHGKKNLKVRARKEVILSAGNFGSAKLLLLSGVGPKEHLKKMKIPLVADLPVGENIQDHCSADVIAYTFPEGVIPSPTHVDHLRYRLFGTGMLSESGFTTKVYQRSKYQPLERKDPYMQLSAFAGLYNPDPTTRDNFIKLHNFNKEAFKQGHASEVGRSGTAVLPTLLHSESKITIRLNSSNPLDDPIITTRFLSDERDMDILIDGTKSIISIMESPAMKAIGAERVKVIDPRCKSHVYGSDEHWRCHIHHNVFNAIHATGSCTMGTPNNTKAVVDSELRVYGVESLRVVDASVMPETPSGNTNFPCMMVGEKAADMIRGIKPNQKK